MARNTEKAVRLWILHRSAQSGESSWVRIRVTEEPVEVGTFYTHEEGWSSEVETFHIDGDALILEAESSGRDCDGQIDRYWVGHCPIADGRLVTVPHHNAGNEYSSPDGRSPVWEELSTGQRDYRAEAAGY